MLSRERTDAYKEVANNGSVGVEATIEEGRHINCRIPHLFLHLILPFDVLPFGFVQLAHRQRQISKVRFVQEKFRIYLICEVCNSPREDIILREIVKASPCEVIQLHEVMIVTD